MRKWLSKRHQSDTTTLWKPPSEHRHPALRVPWTVRRKDLAWIWGGKKALKTADSSFRNVRLHFKIVHLLILGLSLLSSMGGHLPLLGATDAAIPHSFLEVSAHHFFGVLFLFEAFLEFGFGWDGQGRDGRIPWGIFNLLNYHDALFWVLCLWNGM